MAEVISFLQEMIVIRLSTEKGDGGRGKGKRWEVEGEGGGENRQFAVFGEPR